ncbi:hypothetical protein PHISP_08892, partial [Aspergillus sp. HF37]
RRGPVHRPAGRKPVRRGADRRPAVAQPDRQGAAQGDADFALFSAEPSGPRERGTHPRPAGGS